MLALIVAIVLYQGPSAFLAGGANGSPSTADITIVTNDTSDFCPSIDPPSSNRPAFVVDHPHQAQHASVSACPIHQRPLTEYLVPIGYGLPKPFGPTWRRLYLQDRLLLFPFSTAAVDGGCVIPADGPTYVIECACELCVLAEEQWRQAHRRYESTFGVSE